MAVRLRAWLGITDQDMRAVMDWALVGVLAAGAVLSTAIVLGAAVFLFRAIGGV